LKQPEIRYETHTLRFPFANVIFGRVFQIPCDVLFEYSESEEGFRVNITSLTGKAEDGTEYDLLYLTEDDDSLYSEFIVGCILDNKSYWNYESPDGKDWWE
jgi:hypothetical protein